MPFHTGGTRRYVRKGDTLTLSSVGNHTFLPTWLNVNPAKIFIQTKKDGTKEILEYIKDNVDTVILGGGDIVAASNILGYTKDITFASTGGGATLEYLTNHKQPGLINME